MENKETQKEDSGLPSRPLIGSADAPSKDAERKTLQILNENCDRNLSESKCPTFSNIHDWYNGENRPSRWRIFGK
jgi:hypothetical protein